MLQFIDAAATKQFRNGENNGGEVEAKCSQRGHLSRDAADGAPTAVLRGKPDDELDEDAPPPAVRRARGATPPPPLGSAAVADESE